MRYFIWWTHTHTTHTHMFVVNFDGLAQASDIQIKRRQVIFLRWVKDTNPSGSQTPNHQQTDCPLTNRLSYRGSSLNLELDSPSLWSASIQPTRPRSRFGIRTWLWWYTCLLLLILMLWHRQAIFESKGDKLSSSSECRIRTHQGLRHQIASRLNARWQTDWAIEDQAKNLNQQPVPMISQHSAHLTPQPFWHSHLALANIHVCCC